jgi:geranylgeranyl diphosphate synthase type II
MKEYYKQKQLFDKHLEVYIQSLTNDMYVKNIISDALQDGKRIRPIIVMEMTQHIHKTPIENFNLAIAIELIHNASLILDDMPMMDNDIERRNKPTLHYKYNEKIAIFIADMFINNAGILFGQYIKQYIKDKQQLIDIYKIYNDNLGIDGIIGGQLLDLSPLHNFDINIKEKFNSSSFLQMLNEKKTTTLFNLCFLLPFIIHNNYEHIPISDLKLISKSFGITFQLADDIEDLIQDQKRQNDAGITCNFCLQIGNQETISLFKQYMNTLEQYTSKYNLNSKVFCEIMNYLKKKVIQ